MTDWHIIRLMGHKTILKKFLRTIYLVRIMASKLFYQEPIRLLLLRSNQWKNLCGENGTIWKRRSPKKKNTQWMEGLLLSPYSLKGHHALPSSITSCFWARWVNNKGSLWMIWRTLFSVSTHILYKIWFAAYILSSFFVLSFIFRTV